MTHARYPDFSQPLPAAAATIEHVPAFSDSILAAIDRHNEAWSVYQVAPEGAASDAANLETLDALAALLATPCASRFGSLALLSHLRWWLTEEAPNAGSYAEHFAIAEARAADLTLFLGTPALPSVYPEQERVGHAAARVARRITGSRRSRDARFIRSMPDETPGGIEPWEAVTPIRPDTPYSRSPRLLDGMGEAFAALTLVCAGALFIALATLA